MTILNQILRKEHRAAGLTLEEDSDFVYLKKDGKILATFSARGATVEEVLREADQALNLALSGISFAEVK